MKAKKIKQISAVVLKDNSANRFLYLCRLSEYTFSSTLSILKIKNVNKRLSLVILL